MNKKLIKETFKDEMKEQTKKPFDWGSLIADFIGIFIGNVLTDIIVEKASISSNFVKYLIEFGLIVFFIVAANAVLRAIRKK